MHVDLATADLDAQRRRLAGLGATLVAEHDDFAVLADPEGNEFCLTHVPDAPVP